MEKDIKEIKDLALKNSVEITDLTKSVDLIAKTTAKILETMATKDELDTVKKELLSFKLDTVTNFNDLRTDIKSYKVDLNENFKETEKNIDDLYDTTHHHDLRIEKLETKVFV